MHPQLADLLTTTPVLARRQQPPVIARAIDHAVARGELRQVLPGVYCTCTTLLEWRTLTLAACLYLPDAVVTGAAAAALSFWPSRQVAQVTAAHRNPIRTQGPVVWQRQRIPVEWIRTAGPLRITHPAWTAVDLCGEGDSAPLDVALRRGIKLTDLWRAFEAMPGRPNNQTRRLLLKDSRDEPWSPAERLAHKLLRQAGITGWQTNWPVHRYYIDIAWPRLRIAVEVDGFEYHSGPAQFQEDRLRDQILTSEGWVVLRVTWQQLAHDPEGFLQRLRRVLLRRSRDEKWDLGTPVDEITLSTTHFDDLAC